MNEPESNMSENKQPKKKNQEGMKMFLAEKEGVKSFKTSEIYRCWAHCLLRSLRNPQV